MSVFELEHIFIVFHPGAGGNFIASLLEKVVKNDDASINVSTSGAAHTLINRKIAGTDYLSFGTEIDEQSNFKNQDERIDFYLDKIKSEYADVTTSQIIWSHDFTNIPIYKKFFPNSKIIVITQESIKEKIAVVIFNVAKNILDLSAVNPLTEKRMIEVMNMWNHGMRMDLIHLVGESKAKTLRKDSKLIRYISFSRMMLYYKLNKFLESNIEQDDFVNTVLYPSKELLIMGKPPFTVGKNYSEYTVDCVKLPFRYLMDNDVTLLIDAISGIITLDDDKKKIIIDNYNLYRNAQNQEVLDDPVQYFYRIKAEGLHELKLLTT
jgi:hypothetical protein